MDAGRHVHFRTSSHGIPTQRISPPPANFSEGVRDGSALSVAAFYLPCSLTAIMSDGTQSQGSSSQNTTDYIRSATFSRPDGPSTGDAVTASDLLMGAYDPTKLHPLADLGDKLDYLLLDDDKTNELPGAGTAIPSRGWSDDLCYGTGTMYLSGE